MIKKHLSLFLVLIMLCTFGTLITFAEGEDVSSPTEGSNEDVSIYDEAIDTLKRFGIIGDEFEAEKSISRAEFIDMALSLMGADFSASAETGFSDVSADHPFSGAVSAACSMGVVSGYADGNFYPDNTLKKEEAVKILVNILGYKPHAESYGGYPGGYLTVATMQGLLKNTPVGNYVECSFGAAAQLVYNALSVDILQSETYPTERYFTVEGQNPMTMWLEIFEVKGTVSANGYSTLTSLGGIKKGTVKIDDEIFDENGTKISDYLGYPVVAYYLKDDSVNRLMKFDLSYQVYEKEVLSTDIDPATSSSNFVYYYDDYTSESISIIPNPVVVYNGKLYTSPVTASLLKPSEGKVRLVDTNGDKTCDVIYIDESEVYVVSRVSVENGIITDKYGKSALSIDTDSRDTELKIFKDGDEITLADIRVNDVLSVTKSIDSKLVKIIATSDKYRGTVTEISDNYICIDGDEYKIVKANKAEIDKLKVGDYSLFYFTPDYLLAGYGAVSVEGEGYGYIIAALPATDGIAAGKTAECRMFTSAGGVESFTLGEEISINGAPKITGAQAISVLSQGGRFAQLVKFETDKQDKKLIRKISTYIDNQLVLNVTSGLNTGAGNGAYNEAFSLDSKFSSTTSYKYYDQSTGVLDDLYDLSSAQIFSVPTESMWQDFYDGKVDLATIERTFANIDTAAQWAGQYKIYNFEVYDVDQQQRPAVVLEPGGGGGGGAAPTQEMFIFDYFGEGMDSEGYPAKVIYGFYKGEHQSFPVNESSDMFVTYPSLLNLRRGDAIRIGLDANGNVSNLIKVFTFDPYKDSGYDPSDAGQIREMNYSAGAEGSRPNVGNRNYYLLNPYWYNEFNGGDTCESNPNMSWRNIGSPIWGGMMHRVLHCRISGLTSTKFMLDLGKNTAGEQTPTKIIPISGITNYYIYDEEEDEIRIGTLGDVDPDNAAQTVVIRMRYTVPGEMYIINRKETPASEPVWVGRYWQARSLLNKWTTN